MAIHCKVNYADTITYRTDCMSDDSIKKYHLRKQNLYVNSYPYSRQYYKGYEKQIDTKSYAMPNQQSDKIEVGHNPTPAPANRVSRGADNPIICDKLIVDGTFNTVGDCCYKELRFERPLLTGYVYYDYYDTYSDFMEMTYLSWNSPEYQLIDSLYAVVNEHDRIAIYGSGRKWNVQSNDYEEFENKRLVSSGDITDWYNTGTVYRYVYGDEVFLMLDSSKGCDAYYVNDLSRVIKTETSVVQKNTYSIDGSGGYPAWEDYNGLRYYLNNNFATGGLVLPAYYIHLLVKRNYTYLHYYVNITELDSHVTPLGAMIIPFINASEYHAAYAALYHWDDTTQQRVQEALQ